MLVSGRQTARNGFLGGTTKEAAMDVDSGAMMEPHVTQGDKRPEGGSGEVYIRWKGKRGGQSLEKLTTNDVVPHGEKV